MTDLEEAKKQYDALVETVTNAYNQSIGTEQQAIKAALCLLKAWSDDFTKLMAAGRIELTEEENKIFMSHSLHSYSLIRAITNKEDLKTTH